MTGCHIQSTAALSDARPQRYRRGVPVNELLIDALRQSVPTDRLLVDPDAMIAYQHDEAEWAPY